MFVAIFRYSSVDLLFYHNGFMHVLDKYTSKELVGTLECTFSSNCYMLAPSRKCLYKYYRYSDVQNCTLVEDPFSCVSGLVSLASSKVVLYLIQSHICKHDTQCLHKS